MYTAAHEEVPLHPAYHQACQGILVSVLSADTRDLSGQCYGSMLLKLPAELAVAQQAVEYMRSQSGVTVEEVTGI